MAKMVDLAAAGPTEAENAAESAPVYKSTASIHAEDMKKMGMPGLGQGDHVEGTIHGVVSATHEGGMMLHITHGAVKKAAKASKAEKMYGRPADGGDGDGEAGGEGGL